MLFESKLPLEEVSIFAKMSALASEKNAINLSQGFPDFGSDKELLNRINFYIKNGYNQYAPMPGVLKLRERISEKLKNIYNIDYSPIDEITITSGGTQAIYTVIATIVKPYDEVIMFEPLFDTYAPSVILNSGVPIISTLDSNNNFRINFEDLKSKINSKTKLIIINSPHNPTGTVMPKEDIEYLQEITRGTDIYILSDEVHEHILYDNNIHYSIGMFPDLKKRSFIISSFGKTFHLTGWKMGYCFAPSELTKEFRKTHQTIVFASNHPVQLALADYMSMPNIYIDLKKLYHEKRDMFYNEMKNSQFKLTPSQATFFQIANYSNISKKDDIEFSERLCMDYGVAVIPLSPFYINKQDSKIVRFCFAKSETILLKSIQILKSIKNV